jgi:hypothetical protein
MRNVLMLLLMMILFGGALGCGKEDPEARKGVNPFEEKSKQMTGGKDKMMPPGARPGKK